MNNKNINEFKMKELKVVLERNTVRQFELNGLTPKIDLHKETAEQSTLNINRNKIMLFALASDGIFVGIKIFYESFGSEFASFEEYANHCLTTALQLKEKIEKAYCDINNNPRLEINPQVDANYLERVQVLYGSIEIQEIITIERQVICIVHDIKSSLKVDAIKPSECISAINRFLAMLPKLTPLMLKKHPDWIRTAQKLCVYVGDPKILRLRASSNTYNKFLTFRVNVRNLGKVLYENLKDLFPNRDHERFEAWFNDEMKKFDEATEFLTEAKKAQLIKDPTEDI